MALPPPVDGSPDVTEAESLSLHTASVTFRRETGAVRCACGRPVYPCPLHVRLRAWTANWAPLYNGHAV